MDTDEIKTNLKPLKPNIHLNVSIAIMRYAGNWQPQGRYHRFAYFIFTALIFTFTLGHLILEEVANVIAERRSVKKIVHVAPLFLTNIVHAYKYFLIMKHQKRIQNMVDIANGPMFSKNNTRYERIVSWYSWREIFHHTAYQIISLLGILFFMVAPIKGYLAGERQPPISGWFPYEITKSPAFEITWLRQIVSLVLCCTSNIAMDLLISGLMNVASCQFELLKWNIFKIVEDYGQRNVEHPFELSKNLDNEIYKELSNCIRHNMAILDFVAEIQNMFGTIICMQLFINCLIICLTTFFLSQLNTFLTAEVAGYMVYIFVMMYQIFIYCWHGNELHLQHESVSSAIFMSDWWKLSERLKCVLRIMMVRTHQPVTIKAGFFIKLTLPTFVTIIDMSYSMFALLRGKANEIS